MTIGEFRFVVSNRGLAACLATLGIPFKQTVPITMEYGENNPVPKVPFGHPRWKAGRIKWYMEAATESWKINGHPIAPSTLTKAYYSGEAATRIGTRIKAIDDAFQVGNADEAAKAWLNLKNDMPLILAGFIKFAEDNRVKIFMPMIKAAYEEEKITGKSINMITIQENEGEIHTSINPTDEVKENML